MPDDPVELKEVAILRERYLAAGVLGSSSKADSDLAPASRDWELAKLLAVSDHGC